MDNLRDDLIKMNSLTGDELDSHLMMMKGKYTSDQDRRIIEQYLIGEASNIMEDMKLIKKELTIREQMKDIINLVPLSYIAQTYFGKSRAWLYQRINGYKVRGKVYSLNDKEIEIFNRALKDIGTKIGSFSVG